MSSLRLCGKGAVKDPELAHLRQHPIETRLDALVRKQPTAWEGSTSCLQSITHELPRILGLGAAGGVFRKIFTCSQ